MIIRSIAYSLPERVVTNEETVDTIKRHTVNFSGSLDKGLKTILKLLNVSGLREKRWCSERDKPIDHMAEVVRRVLDASHLKARDVDLLIYVGIGRGFLEPGNSHLLAAALGFKNAECFDVVDACQSYIRGLRIADSLFKAGSTRIALVVNAEFNMLPGGGAYPDNFRLESLRQLSYTFPSYTIGEAATATLLTADEPDNFEFHFISRPDLAELCTIPLPNFDRFCTRTDKIGRNGVGRFASYGAELHEHAMSECVAVLNRHSGKDKAATIFVHASSKREWDKFGQRAGVSERIHHVYPFTGNIVSASVPVAMADAIQKNKVKKGDYLLFWVGSAGMSFSSTGFTYY